MVHISAVILRKTTYKATGSTPGLTAASLMVPGWPTRCKVLACSHGQMEENIKEITTMTRKKAKVSLPGRMAASMMANG